MKILFYLRIVVIGGAEKYVLKLLSELKKRNIEVGFFCTLQDNNEKIIQYFSEELNRQSIPIIICKAPPVSIKAAKCLAQTIKKGNYTILHAHLMHAEITSMLSKLLLGTSCKFVTTKHGYLQKFMDEYGLDYIKVKKWKLSYQVEKFVQRFVTKNFAVSEGVAKFYILSEICKPSKMEVIYHGLETDFCNNDEPAIRISENQLLIAGRLRKFKGHELLLKAVKYLKYEISDFKLIILGEGEEKDKLLSIVKREGLDEVVFFAGFSKEVCPYFKGSDLVVAPSIVEPFGLIVLEAYSCSKPVVAFDVTAFNENIVNNETGFLIKPYDTKELANKIKYLLENKNIAKQMGVNGYKLLQDKFSFDASIEKTIDFYKSV